MLRSCPRCAKDFEAIAGQWICVECRYVRGYVRPIAGSPLTPREVSVVALLGQCMTNKEIATSLHLEVGTVKVYMSTIFIKLGLDSRLKVAMWANSEEFSRVKSDTIRQ